GISQSPPNNKRDIQLTHFPDVKPLRTFTGNAQNAKFQWFNWSTKVLNSEQTDETHPPPSP
ncbi:hypothetical protein, partial [Mesorhizobium sp. M2D.F.Ca.ET.206.01.1.1]|uniref:hypothetical protein n=1 Tax=Mesorhizobium sp. M2D.F.Ca.ET.206.01.1.1 TaxID=2563939 RepID=UPI001AEE1475